MQKDSHSLDHDKNTDIPKNVISDIKLKSILDHAGVGIIVLDCNNNHILSNPTFSGITGFEKEEIIGTPIPGPYWPDVFSKELSDIISHLRKSHYIRAESYFQRKDRTLFPVLIIGNIIKDETHGDEAILIIEDITKTKRTERELQLTQMMLIAMNKDLERKINERTNEIQRLLKQKDEFMNHLSRDLQNNLLPIKQLLPKISKDITNKKTNDALDTVNVAVKNMEHMIEKTRNLSLLNSIDSGFENQRLDVFQEYDRCIQKKQKLIHEKNIKIENTLAKDTFIKFDRLCFNELIDIILTNSIRYSPKNGNIKISSSTTKTSCIISIKDHGIGMTKDELHHIFNEANSSNHNKNNSKAPHLGLSTCKQIIENHDGRIWAESNGINKGTTIYFSLPLWEEEQIPTKNNTFYLNNRKQHDFEIKP